MSRTTVVLRPQADNLAAFLYWMQQKKLDHFANVQDTVRQIAPFFEEFRLEPSKLKRKQNPFGMEGEG